MVKAYQAYCFHHGGRGYAGPCYRPVWVRRLDGKGLIGGELYEMPLERKAPGVIFRQPVNQPLADRSEGCGRHDTYRPRTA